MGGLRGIGGVLLGASCVLIAQAAVAWRPPPISVERGPGEQVARTRAGDCPIALEHRLEWGSLTYRNDCAQGLDEKGRVLDALLAALFGEAPLPGEIGSLGLGRIIGFSEEVALRMALDAHADPAWAEALRRHRDREADSHGLPGRWVSAWIVAASAFEPLAAPLYARGVAPRAASVEKVLITPPVPTALGAQLAARGVPADANLPFDAQVWLVLEREPSAAPAPEPEAASDRTELRACLARSHVEQCTERLPKDDGGPCDATAAPVPIVGEEQLVAQAEGDAGWVELEARISPAGAPSNPRVVASQPEGVLDARAIRAFARWRYCPSAHRGKQVRVRLHFRERR